MQVTKGNRRLSTMNSTQNAVLYVRVSTDDQALSIDAQISTCRDYAERSGYAVVGECVDHGVSGAASIDNRPALLDALAALEEGATVLVVAKRDRLARDTMSAVMLERMAERAGARIECADGAGNGDSPEAVLLRRMIDVFAEYERNIIRARTRVALAQKAARGERLGRPPFGYRVENGELVEVEEQQTVIRLVVELRGQGLSQNQIVAELEAGGHRNSRGRPFARSAVCRILKAA